MIQVRWLVSFLFTRKSKVSRSIVIVLIYVALFLPTSVSRSLDVGDLQVARFNCHELVVRGLWTQGEGTLRVVVESKYDEAQDACFRTLKIVQGAAGRVLYSEATGEAPVAIVPLGGRLLTIWGSGSAFHITALQRTADGARKVLDVRPKGLPEIVFSKSGGERLIFTNDREKADIYLWTGERYDQRLGVPWEHRFDYVE